MTRRVVYRGRRITVEEVDVTGPGGLATREVIDHPGSVVVLPFVDEENVVVIHNFRPSIGAELLELVAEHGPCTSWY